MEPVSRFVLTQLPQSSVAVILDMSWTVMARVVMVSLCGCLHLFDHIIMLFIVCAN